MAVEGAPVEPDRTPVRDRGASPAPPADLAAHVREEQRLVDRLLAHRASRRRGRGGGGQEPGDGDLGRVLSGDVTDPEFRKNLLIYRRLVGEAAYLHARAQLWASGAGSVAVLDRADELRARTTLPTDLPLTLKTLLAHRFELEQFLIELGDEDYIAARLADVYDETGTHATWKDLYGGELPALLPGPVGSENRPADGAQVVDRAAELEATRRRLSRLMHVKQAEDEVFRARQELKRRAALLVTVVLGVVAVLFGAAVAWVVDDDRLLAAAVAAGAAGAALGGLFTLRDQVNLGAQLRQFWPFFCGQVVVGAVAGLLAFLVDQSGVIDVGGRDLGMAALAFAVGFSEAALLGLLGKLAGPFGGAGAPDRADR